MTSEAEAFWKDWIEGERSVPNLRLHVVPLLEQIRLASQRQDWDAFQRLMETYSNAAPYCEEEPLLTVFEGGMMYVNAYLAENMCISGDLARAIEHISSIRETLIASDERRISAGMVQRPNSELRIIANGVHALCLLEDECLFSNRQPELETALIAAEFWRAADTLVENIGKRYVESDAQANVLMHILARWELEICKLCWRFNQSFAVVAIDLFNERTGHQLEAQSRHFMQVDQLDARSGWYWDFELSKLESAGDYTHEEVLHCSERRSRAARLSFGSGPLLIIEQLWSRQIHRLLNS